MVGDGAPGGPRCVGFQCEAQPRPDVPQPGLNRLVRRHPADRRAEFRGARRILLQAGDLAAHPFVEGGAQVRAVRAHLVELGVHRRQHAPCDRGAESPADQAAALLAHPFLDGDAQRVFLGRQQVAELAEDEAEHLLVAAAFDQAVQCAGHDLAGARAAQDARHDAGDKAAGTAVLHGGEDARQHGGERDRGRAGGDGVGEEAVQDAGQVEAGQHAGDLVLGEHVGGDEAAEGGAETLLLARDDGGVGDRDAERVAEQRGDREPVGDAADEAGLGGGLEEVGGCALGEGVGAEGESGHQDEEASGEDPVAVERAAGFGVGVGWGGHAGLSVGWAVLMARAGVASPPPPSPLPQGEGEDFIHGRKPRCSSASGIRVQDCRRGQLRASRKA